MGKFIYDAEASVELRDPDAAAVTATTTGTDVALDWGSAGAFAVALVVNSIDRVTGDESYVLTIESLDTDGANAFTQFTLPAVVETGEYRILLDGETAEKFDSDAARVRAVMTVGGTTPSIDYGCWIMPAYGAAGRP